MNSVIDSYHHSMFLEELRPIRHPVFVTRGPPDNNEVFVAGFMSNQVVVFRNEKWEVFAGGYYCNRKSLKGFDSCAILDGPFGMEFDGRSKFYVSSFGSDQILVFNLTSNKFIGAMGDSSSLNCPESIVFGPDGQLYVANFGDSNIVVFNVSTGQSKIFAQSEQLQGPEQICFVGNNLFVTSHFNDQVLRYSSNGTLLNVVAHVDKPVGIVCKDDYIYVTSYTQNKIVEFDIKSREEKRTFRGKVRGPSGMYLTNDEHGEVLHVASYDNHRVIVFNTTHNAARYALSGTFPPRF